METKNIKVSVPFSSSLLEAHSGNALVYLEIQREFTGSEDTQLDLRNADFQIFKVVSFLSSALFNNLLMEVFIIVFNLCLQTKHRN